VGEKWTMKCIGFFRRDLIPVELFDHTAKSYYTLARKDKNGDIGCPVYYITGTGWCILKDNGRIDIRSESRYIFFWLPLNKQNRFMAIMSNDYPDFKYLKTVNKDECWNTMIKYH
jgi:hypothetical protein